MTIDGEISDEKLQCDISRAAAKTFELSSIKYGYLAGDKFGLHNSIR